MPEQPEGVSRDATTTGSASDGSSGGPSAPLPPEIKKVLEELPAPEAKTLLSLIIARSTTSFGPDAETARILVEAEQHEEDCRLEGYKATLANREKQGMRDHEFRIKKLNREFAMSMVVLVGAIALCGVGLYLTINGQTVLGSNLLVGGAMLLLYLLKGSPDFFAGKQ
jgi:hypothetical protein